MNVYTCSYQGNYGYGCRTRGRKWMFVPELGQSDNNIYKNLHLEDLVFKNLLVKELELDREIEMGKFNLIKILVWIFTPQHKLHTVGGLLFTTF